jgi:hypothetical protein
MIIMISICFTQGHISIRRGRVTRQYARPTLTSYRRLATLCQYGPCDETHYTNRSSVTVWHGLSTLDVSQRAIYRLYLDANRDYQIAYDTMALTARANGGYFHQTGRPFELCQYALHYMLGVKNALQATGIHPVLLDPTYRMPHEL